MWKCLIPASQWLKPQWWPSSWTSPDSWYPTRKHSSLKWSSLVNFHSTSTTLIRKQPNLGNTNFLNGEKKKKTSSETSFTCDQCDHDANCKVSLRNHIDKHYKLIPQLDGFGDGNSVEEKSSQTEVMNVKKVGVQTDPMDTSVTVKWGKENNLPYPQALWSLR